MIKKRKLYSTRTIIYLVWFIWSSENSPRDVCWKFEINPRPRPWAVGMDEWKRFGGFRKLSCVSVAQGRRGGGRPILTEIDGSALESPPDLGVSVLFNVRFQCQVIHVELVNPGPARGSAVDYGPFPCRGC